MRFKELDRQLGVLAERVMRNEAARYRGAGVPKPPRTQHYSESIFDRSKHLDRHPLDRKYRCGFDPVGKTIKEYRLHISGCQHEDCQDRRRGWFDLAAHFSRIGMRHPARRGE